MREKFVLLSISIVASLLTVTPFTSVFSQEPNTEEYGFKSCIQDGEFRLLHVYSEKIDEVVILKNITISSGFFNKTSIPDKFPGYVYKVIENGVTVELNDTIKRENGPEKIYCIHHLDSQNSSLKNSSYLIISGADPCGADGAFRIVNVHWNQETDEVLSVEQVLSVEVFSLYFEKSDFGISIVGISTFHNGSIEELNGDIHVDKIYCDDDGVFTKEEFTIEEFEFNITEERFLNLNLPPIRSYG